MRARAFATPSTVAMAFAAAMTIAGCKSEPAAITNDPTTTTKKPEPVPIDDAGPDDLGAPAAEYGAPMPSDAGLRMAPAYGLPPHKYPK